MSELNKQLSQVLEQALTGLPENVASDLMKDWTAEARGAKKVCDMKQVEEGKRSPSQSAKLTALPEGEPSGEGN